MIKNYWKLAWRNLQRNRAFSVINISGLTLGLACSLLIFLWIQDERSVDAFHANGKEIYQVYERNIYQGRVAADWTTQALLADELKRVVPGVKYAAPLEWNAVNTFRVDNKPGKFTGTFAGGDFFNMFSYPLLQGTAAAALQRPEAVAISRRMAEYFFGSPQQAINKTLRYEDTINLQVTAVFDNLPVNSSHQFDFLRSWSGFVNVNRWVHNWNNTDPMTYVQLTPGADAEQVRAKIKDFVYGYISHNPSSRTELDLLPFRERYLHNHFSEGRIAGGRIEYVRLFGIVAVFILLIACINFMNLSTARSAQRAREVGIRKVVGALRGGLIGQFIGEAMLLTAIAVIAAVLLVSLVLPAFNGLTGKALILPWQSPLFWTLLAGLLLVTGFVAGSYPALVLSSLNPIRVLKGALRFGRGATWFRQGLVVFQFSLSVILIVGVIVIYRQMNYTQTRNLGFDRDNLVYIPIEGRLVKDFHLFKQEAGKLAGILAITKMAEAPTGIGHHVSDIAWEGKQPGQDGHFANAVVGYDLARTLHLKMKEGRDFSTDYPTDSLGYLVNETAVEKIGYKYPVTGKPLAWGNHKGVIIGVVKDFHFNSMHQPIEPLVIRLHEAHGWGNILVRVQAGHTKEALTGLESLCKDINPQFPFSFQFADQEYDKLYQSEKVVSKLAGAFAALAIFISCLGLFGLATFTAGQRTREIGVRKVLGATVPDIIRLLSGHFLRPVALAMAIGFPIAWYSMDSWLQNYAYKIGIEWWMFAFAGALTVVIALLTVGFQSIRAAIRNPVASLRTE